MSEDSGEILDSQPLSSSHGDELEGISDDDDAEMSEGEDQVMDFNESKSVSKKHQQEERKKVSNK